MNILTSLAYNQHIVNAYYASGISGIKPSQIAIMVVMVVILLALSCFFNTFAPVGLVLLACIAIGGITHSPFVCDNYVSRAKQNIAVLKNRHYRIHHEEALVIHYNRLSDKWHNKNQPNLAHTYKILSHEQAKHLLFNKQLDMPSNHKACVRYDNTSGGLHHVDKPSHIRWIPLERCFFLSYKLK